MKITQVSDLEGLEIVCSIAWRTWPVCYKELLTADQIDYMLQLFYTVENLEKNCLQMGHLFYLIWLDEEAIGFASIALDHEAAHQAKLHKLYVLPAFQQLGAGMQLLNRMLEIAKAANQTSFILHVNRGNPSMGFYEKIGFENVKAEDFNIGNGYFMNDFLMRKSLKNKQ